LGARDFQRGYVASSCCDSLDQRNGLMYQLIWRIDFQRLSNCRPFKGRYWSSLSKTKPVFTKRQNRNALFCIGARAFLELPPPKNCASAKRKSDSFGVNGWHQGHALLPRRKRCIEHGTHSYQSFSRFRTKNCIQILRHTTVKLAASTTASRPEPMNYVLQSGRFLKSFTINQLRTGLTEATGLKKVSLRLLANFSSGDLQK